ncbi:hypothetical protein K458DRAFT_486697 [Lentithecium fluviatile CBS 122367]|uniref:Uncharacterized protein n=1 Tax=Lentithecium fluviatile CBS 122367 TaxID=1168545 RepID=A0A6G1J6X6_9PLEO|nr:hypothetical protein K458DRAFT_486697 [Lentithecium fluviatile CBS 122367]
MSNRTGIAQSIRFCSELDGNAVYECLRTHIGDNDPTRSLTEVILRSLGIHVIALTSYGHLLSMQGLTTVRSPLLYLSSVLFFFFPTLAGTEILVRIVRVCSQAARTRRSSYRYCIAASLGIHVVVSGLPRPLDDIDPSNLRFEKKERTLVWGGRLVVLLLFLVQYTGTIVISMRAAVFLELGNNFWYQDRRNLGVALGGVVAVLNSICICLINGDWNYAPASTGPIQLSSTEIFSDPVPDLNEPSSAARSTLETNFSIIEHDAPSATKNHFMENMRRKNCVFSESLPTRFPATLQIAADYAQISRHLFNSVIDRSSHNGYLAQIYYCLKNPNQSRDGFCYPTLRVFPTRFWSSMGFHPWPYPKIINALVGISIARIILADIFRLVLWFIPQALPVVRFPQKWILGGRSITAFTVFLVSLLFNLVLWAMEIATRLYLDIYAEANRVYGVEWTKFNYGLASYRDPWQDSATQYKPYGGT